MPNPASDPDLLCRQLSLGGDRNFCYLIGDRRSQRAVAVDPGFDAPAMAAAARDLGWQVERILLTHGHSDHVAAAAELVQLTGATLHAGELEKITGALPLADGQEFDLGGFSVTAVSTPGHSPDHYCFLSPGLLTTGDLLFCGKIGGTGPYFPGSSARMQYDSLARIVKLPESVLVYPGHDYYGGPGERPYSTIGLEKAENPFLNTFDFEGFRRLKENWATYKKEHGIR